VISDYLRVCVYYLRLKASNNNSSLLHNIIMRECVGTIWICIMLGKYLPLSYNNILVYYIMINTPYDIRNAAQKYRHGMQRVFFYISTHTASACFHIIKVFSWYSVWYIVPVHTKSRYYYSRYIYIINMPGTKICRNRMFSPTWWIQVY